MAQLPPLTALRALEAAVRHRSYSRAAEELNLTHGAISHQIRRLEDELGIPLFQRRGAGMEPLPAAARLATSVIAAMSLLGRAIDEAQVGRSVEPLILSSEQGFARRWLAPRLSEARAAAGGHDLDIRLENRLAEFVGDGVDAAIRFGDGDWPGFEVTPLLPVQFYPVCNPRLIEGCSITRPSDLFRLPLLRHTHPLWSWPWWFRALGLDSPPDGGMMFDDSSLMLEAAAHGVGVALARSTLAEPDLDSGRLVRPLPDQVEGSSAYYFVWRSGAEKLDRILAFRNWLLECVHGPWAPTGDRPMV